MSDRKASSNRGRAPESGLESLQVGSVVYTTRLTNKFRNRPRWKQPDMKRIEAVIPGTIQRIMAREGEEVKAGTPLLILEAMKMRNEVLSTIDGVVRKIHVVEGEMVPKSHLLVELG
jgi:biotin carboxyl carrier protein